MNALTKADCEVTAARGRMIAPGCVAFSGLLWVRGQPIASFSNEGNGGCNAWVERNQYASLLAEFDALAVREFPEFHFEQRDHLAGALWDAAILKSKPTPKLRGCTPSKRKSA